MQAEISEAQKDVATAEAEAEEAKAQQAKLQKKVEQLKAQLEEERGKTQPQSKKVCPLAFVWARLLNHASTETLKGSGGRDR